MTAETFDRFYEPEPMSGCWLWTGALNSDGYANGKFRGVTLAGHQIAWLILRGPPDPTLQIDHGCRVRSCVNPAHLEQVTSRENTVRGEGPAAHQARQTHCQRGHPLTGENLYRRSAGRHRQCRLCGVERDRLRVPRRRAWAGLA